MKTCLGVWVIFSISFPTGAGLVCEKCKNNNGAVCTKSTTETCGPSVTSCYTILLVENLGFLSHSQTWKSCANHPVFCDATYISIGVEVYSTIRCCRGDLCNKGSIKLAPINRTENGVRCPACYGKGKAYAPITTMKCQGPQTKCFSSSGAIYNGAHFEDWALRGCCTENMCHHDSPTYPESLIGDGYRVSCSDPIK
ncbi:phospholipase A2 inhibitor and Ly6/PLAUR domain-containing protein-like [Leptodactylus fuscus]|uniref:phospholipase A2 inhibitor and Ly6/PLAUR domain-containing protein-like n=1 Tax=Leptodactylus fuscus TaxID=238119 RepID=UPI003F4EA9E9